MAHLGTPSQSHPAIPDRYYIDEDHVWAGRQKSDLAAIDGAAGALHFRRITPNPAYRPGGGTGGENEGTSPATRLLFGPPNANALRAALATPERGGLLRSVAESNRILERSLLGGVKGGVGEDGGPGGSDAVRVLEAQIHAKDTLLAQERAKVLELRSSLERSHNEVAELRARRDVEAASVQAAEVLELQGLVVELRTENAELERMLHSSTSAVHSELQSQARKHVTELEALRHELSPAQGAVPERPATLAVEDALRKAQKEALEAQHAARAAELENASLRAELRDARARIAELEAKMAAREDSIDAQSRQLQRLAEHASGADAAQLNVMVSQLEAEKRALEAVVRSGSHRAGEQRSASPPPSRAAPSADAGARPGSDPQVAHLTDQLREFEAENSELRMLVAELQAARGTSFFDDDDDDDGVLASSGNMRGGGSGSVVKAPPLVTFDDEQESHGADGAMVVRDAGHNAVAVAGSGRTSIFRSTVRSTPLPHSSLSRGSPAPTPASARKHVSHLPPTPPASVFAARSRANWWPQRDVDARHSASRLRKRAWRPPGPEPPLPNQPSVVKSPPKAPLQ